MTDLTALLERCKAATGPDRELDAAIGVVCRVGNKRVLIRVAEKYPDFTSSIDAVLALIRHELPGWSVEISATNGIANDVYLIGPNYDDSKPEQQSSKPYGGMPTALALFCALLSAKIAMEAENG